MKTDNHCLVTESTINVVRGRNRHRYRYRKCPVFKIDHDSDSDPDGFKRDRADNYKTVQNRILADLFHISDPYAIKNGNIQGEALLDKFLKNDIDYYLAVNKETKEAFFDDCMSNGSERRFMALLFQKTDCGRVPLVNAARELRGNYANLSDYFVLVINRTYASGISEKNRQDTLITYYNTELNNSDVSLDIDNSIYSNLTDFFNSTESVQVINEMIRAVNTMAGENPDDKKRLMEIYITILEDTILPYIKGNMRSSLQRKEFLRKKFEETEYGDTIANDIAIQKNIQDLTSIGGFALPIQQHDAHSEDITAYEYEYPFSNGNRFDIRHKPGFLKRYWARVNRFV